jgi:hypothetical protein
MIYTVTITNVPLRLRECRIVADLLLQGISDSQWKTTVTEGNVLQLKSAESIRQVSRMLRARLEPMGEGLWEIVRDGSKELATQAALAATIKNSRLLGDFMDITLREQRALFAEKLEYRMWNEFIAGCRGRDPDMPDWGEATVARLRSSVFSILAEGGYLKDTRSLLMQNVFLDAALAAYLRDRGESYVVRCLEVAE